jgi:predicted ATPase
MAIKHIEIQNFKSFSHQTIELGQFNVLIGANASGKTNFLQLFKFISDIAHHGLNNAISLQGGVEYLTNTNIKTQQDLLVKMVIDSTPEMAYQFALRFDNQGRFHIVQDKLALVPKNQHDSGELRLTHVSGNLQIENTLSALFPELFDNRLLKTLKPHQLLLEQPLFKLILAALNDVDIFENIAVYDFDAKQPKKAALQAGKLDLEEDSRNLAIVLKNILADNEKKRLFFNMLTYILPFVEDVRVEPVADKYFIITLRETYSKAYLPTTFISEGTLNALSLVTTLYFQEKPLLLIEEPEKHLYPCLISKMVSMLQEISKRQQIIMTTHESEAVKYAELGNLLFIYRDQDGFSRFSKLAEKEEINRFLQSDAIGIEDLYLDDFLGM